MFDEFKALWIRIWTQSGQADSGEAEMAKAVRAEAGDVSECANPRSACSSSPVICRVRRHVDQLQRCSCRMSAGAKDFVLESHTAGRLKNRLGSHAGHEYLNLIPSCRLDKHPLDSQDTSLFFETCLFGVSPQNVQAFTPRSIHPRSPIFSIHRRTKEGSRYRLPRSLCY